MGPEDTHGVPRGGRRSTRLTLRAFGRVVSAREPLPTETDRRAYFFPHPRRRLLDNCVIFTVRYHLATRQMWRRCFSSGSNDAMPVRPESVPREARWTSPRTCRASPDLARQGAGRHRASPCPPCQGRRRSPGLETMTDSETGVTGGSKPRLRSPGRARIPVTREVVSSVRSWADVDAAGEAHAEM